MDWQNIQADWGTWQDKFQAHWPDLSAERLSAVKGDRTELARYVSETYELTKTEAVEAIDDVILVRHRH